MKQTLTLLSICLSTVIYAQYPCPNSNTFYASGNAPTVLGDSVRAPCIYGGEYIVVNGMNAGSVYDISTCYNSNFDTQISIYDNSGNAVAYNDDWCGMYSDILFSPPTSGSYRILVNEYDCISNQLCANLSIQLVYEPRPIIEIPVVVHVVYNTPQENISNSQIQSQIDVLNEDFRRLNLNQQNAPTSFKGRAMDPLIQFCLASRTPNGQSTNGIERIPIPLANWTKAQIDGALKPNTIWDKNSYLNLWVVNFSPLENGLLGYATFPYNGTDTTDGVVIGYTCFGTTGAATFPNNLGRTATHEIGHWLNLKHIWGDDHCANPNCTATLLATDPQTCLGDDLVFDTPNSAIPIYGCSVTYPYRAFSQCGTDAFGEMFMNYMDYGDDACLNLFTVGQFVRIDDVVFNDRASLWNSLGCVPCNITSQFSPSTLTPCVNQTVNFTNQGSSGSYTWLVNGTVYATTTNFSAFFNAVGQYQVALAVNSNGCSDTSYSTLNVSANPIASISPTTVTICNGQSATLIASGGGTYSWSNSLGSNSQVTVSPSSTTTYTVIVTANGCTATASRAVNVNATPSASISPTTAAICNGSNITLTATGGGTYSWSNSLGTNSQVTVSPSSTTTYTVTVTLNSCSATASRTVTVNSIPSASIAPTTATICNGSSITLTASGGGTYSWSNSLGINAQVTVSPISTIAYTVTVTSNNCSATASRTVTVNSKPNIPTFSPTSGCSPVTVTANSTNCTGCSYNWSTGATGTTATFSSTSNYTVTATNSNNCTASANGTITITGQPSVSITSPVTGFCTGSTTTLSTNPTGTSYSWSGPNGFTSSSPQVTINTGGSYSVTVTNPGACTGTATASYSITQYPVPNADAGSNVTIQQGNSTTLTATGGVNYSWSNGANTASTTVSPNSTTTYTVTVTDGNNCTATDNVTVSVQGACNNVYTLSSDSVNVPAFGGNCNTNLTTDAACSWNVNAGGCISWVIVNTPNGSGSSAISFTVDTNYLPSKRTCFAIIEGNLFSIIQAAASITDIQELSALKNISAFPNPNPGVFTLSIESTVNQKINANIFNSLGQLILKREIETNSQTEFDLSANAKGIYYLQLQSVDRNYYVKVSVE